ncbi:MAG: hypothetical protein M5U19_03075 [Microthrixaceae bacterium]|nr:hypothetical protein [Microthrixaceae bacterium]
MDTAQFLTERRNAGVTPEVITRELVANGWSADNAAAAALRSLRRTDHHALLYWTLTFSAGFAALATASALHLAMIPEDHRSALALATWITIALVALPLALVSGHFARDVEARSAHAVWSPTRRALFGTLAGATAVVGMGRLLTYVFEAVAALVGVTGYELTPASLPQVIVSMAVSVPLFAWALIEWRRSNVLIRGLGDGAGGKGAPGSDDRSGGTAETGRGGYTRGMFHEVH